MMMSRDVVLAIGVAEAKPLPYLGGAVNGAHAFYEWASKIGYDSYLLTDEHEAVTILRLRKELESILKPGGGPIHRMVLYFAGHGLIREAEEGLWLLSDWYSEQRAVAVEVVKRRLYMHDIDQIAIFADCCRSLPPDIMAADLTPDGVLGRGPMRPQKTPAIDKFIAAQDGTAAFMVPGATPDEDRCLFSGVLMEALWGTKPEAFSKLLNDKVTSRSLGAYLEAKVPERAKYYQRKLFPNVSPTFPEGDDIYFYPGVGAPPKPPPFSEWPPPSAVVGTELHWGDVNSTPEAEENTSSTSTRSTTLIEQIRNQSRPDAFETGAGFAVDGAVVRDVWTTPDVIAKRHGQPNWWRLTHSANPKLLRSAPLLIEFEDGMFAAAVGLPKFIATIMCNERGISALIYRRLFEPVDTAAVAESAIAAMEKGALRANAATDLAIALRTEKHSDPVLGVISAYLYDSIGDVENIRRMAFYYTQHNQPIPFDIALLAQLRGEWRNDLLWAHVPAVSERDARTDAEERYGWTHSATDAAVGEVGGLWPWMRQGWPFLDDPKENGSTLVSPGLIELSRHLTPGRFTTLDIEGAVSLAKIFNLAKRG